MNLYFLSASCLVFITGLVHSVLGEKRIFLPLKRNTTQSGKHSSLKLSHIRILWVTWHFATLLGWGCAVLLMYVAMLPTTNATTEFVNIFQTSSMVVFFLAFLLTLLGTRGRHLGWLALLIVAILIYLA